MSKNRSGGFSRQTTGKEWGSKARKEEAEIRGLNNRARFEAIAEQVADLGEGPTSQYSPQGIPGPDDGG